MLYYLRMNSKSSFVQCRYKTKVIITKKAREVDFPQAFVFRDSLFEIFTNRNRTNWFSAILFRKPHRLQPARGLYLQNLQEQS